MTLKSRGRDVQKEISGEAKLHSIAKKISITRRLTLLPSRQGGGEQP